jgi:succinoglycan biosynthesis transport protein ExoP
LNELSAKFGPGYPKVAELQSSLDSTQKSIRDEAARVAARVQNDYTVAQQIEDKDRAVYLDEKDQAEGQNDKAVQYQIAQAGSDPEPDLYENLVSRMKEADLVAGMRSSNITLVDAARVPARPAKPNALSTQPLRLPAAFSSGYAGRSSATLPTPASRNWAKWSCCSPKLHRLAPYHKCKIGTEAHGRLENVGIRSLLPRPPDGLELGGCGHLSRVPPIPKRCACSAPRSCRATMGAVRPGLLVTSSVSGEGKSMLSTNLAIVYAQRGKKVLLVDGDLRTPVLHRCLNLDSSRGLSSLLTKAMLTTRRPRRRFPSLASPVSTFCRPALCPPILPNCWPPMAWRSWCVCGAGV